MTPRLAAGLVAGLLLTATLPPLGWWPLGVAGVAVLYAVLGGAGARHRLLVGLVVGLGLYGPGLWWATEFHALGWVVLVLLEALVLAVSLALVPAARGGLAAAVALPAALVVAEAFRGRWPFGGLPLAGIDLGQVDGPLLPVARIGGHLLLVGVLGVAGVAVGELARAVLAVRRGGGGELVGRRVVFGVIGLAVTGAAAVGGAVAADGRGGGSLTVAAVQGGGPRGLRAVGRDPRPVFEAHLAASAGVRAGTDLVVWPEDVVDVEGAFAGSPEESELAALARRLGATVVAGVVEDGPGESRSLNAAVAFGPDGRQVARYDKVHRVPFGEYVPFRPFFDRLADLSQVPRDAIPGRGPAVLRTPLGRLGVVISYEVFFAERARSAVRSGATLLLVPTNASSFTTRQVPAQELVTARLRAVETGRWVVQAAPTGYTGVVDHRGRVRAQGPLGDAALLQRTVGLRTGQTLASRLGGGPVAVVAFVLLASAWIRRRKLE